MKTTTIAATIRFATASTAIGTGIVASVADRWVSRWRYVCGVSHGVLVRLGLESQSLAERLAVGLGLATPAMACRPASPLMGDSSSNRSSAVA